ncbi:ADP-ribosylhydrolase ARH1-like isoform X2 [Buteo buteo]|uniref:ADP-ribosylhydrolase ARH1-like isoform X2 n=1 Tax=Buteo buteo TaxID=30397 RepID=UPI003EC0B2BE
MEETVPSVEAYEAAMVLSGVGDALGYRGGRWEYCTSGPQIHAELAELGGLEAITLEPPEWPVSDDTVLHLATAEGLATGLEGEPLLQELARRYVAAMGDMEGRKPGPTSILGTSQLRPGEPEGYRIPFNPTGTGCGAAMRSLAIGLRYPHARELPTLIRVSIESGRMTHHHPTGYLGALAVALFGALGARGEPPERWGAELLRVLPLAWDYVEGAGVAVGENAAAWPFFGDAWHRATGAHPVPAAPSVPTGAAVLNRGNVAQGHPTPPLTSVSLVLLVSLVPGIPGASGGSWPTTGAVPSVTSRAGCCVPGLGTGGVARAQRP